MNKNSTSQYNTSPKFGAIPRAKYILKNGEQVRLYELEKSDLPFISKFSQNMDSYIKKNNITNDSRKEIMKISFDVAGELLQRTKKERGKNRIFVEESGSNILGILICNMPKKTPNGKTIYSSRKNASKKETELNWLTTWNTKEKEEKGLGKVLLGEFFKSLKQDSLKKVFVEAEVPEKTYAEEFYTKMGFKTISSHRKKISQIEYNQDKIENSGHQIDNDEIIPMLASKKSINNVSEQISEEFHRQKLPNKSVKLFNIIK